jgi:hypothetical protein
MNTGLIITAWVIGLPFGTLVYALFVSGLANFLERTTGLSPIIGSLGILLATIGLIIGVEKTRYKR